MKRFAVILGASGDIGESIARELAEAGWSLYLHRHTRNLDALAMELSSRFPAQEFIQLQADFAVRGSGERLAEAVFDASCIVVANGHDLVEMLVDTTAEEMEKLWLVHVQNPLQCIRRLSPFFHRRQTSYVVFISSIWGEAGASMESAYSAVKGAQLSFVKAYAKEMAYAGTRVNAIAPGLIMTKMNAQLDDGELRRLAEEIPLGFGSPEDIAHMAAFLVSGKADYVTGQTIGVNGGWYM